MWESSNQKGKKGAGARQTRVVYTSAPKGAIEQRKRACCKTWWTKEEEILRSWVRGLYAQDGITYHPCYNPTGRNAQVIYRRVFSDSKAEGEVG